MRWVGFWWKPPGWKSFQYDVVDMSSTQDHLSQQWWNWAKILIVKMLGSRQLCFLLPRLRQPLQHLHYSPHLEWRILLLRVKLADWWVSDTILFGCTYHSLSKPSQPTLWLRGAFRHKICLVNIQKCYTQYLNGETISWCYLTPKCISIQSIGEEMVKLGTILQMGGGGEVVSSGGNVQYKSNIPI